MTTIEREPREQRENQTENQTSAHWGEVIRDLTKKASDLDLEIGALTAERDSLALDAEMGDERAAKRLQVITRELNAKPPPKKRNASVTSPKLSRNTSKPSITWTKPCICSEFDFARRRLLSIPSRAS
jgi:hypothetical protein